VGKNNNFSKENTKVVVVWNIFLFFAPVFWETGVPVSPSKGKFIKEVKRSGREENPGNNLQTNKLHFQKTVPARVGYGVVPLPGYASII
jgi:hypothetical protein